MARAASAGTPDPATPDATKASGQGAPAPTPENVAAAAAGTGPAVAPLPNPPAPSTVATARYADGKGWGVGQAAPEDQYMELDGNGQPTGKASSKPPEGKYATQVAVKGDVVTDTMRRTLGKGK